MSEHQAGDILEANIKDSCQWLVIKVGNNLYMQRWVYGKPEEELYGLRNDFIKKGTLKDNYDDLLWSEKNNYRQYL